MSQSAVRSLSMDELSGELGDGSSTDAAAPKAKFVCLDTTYLSEAQQGLEISLISHELTLGRDVSNSIQIDSAKLSRHHAKIVPGDGCWGVQDLGSTNGVRVNKDKVEKAWLKPGDRVDIGAIPFRYELVTFDISDEDDDANERGDLDKTVMVGAGAHPVAAAPPRPVVIEPQPQAQGSKLVPILVILGLVGVAAYLFLGT